MRKFFGNIFDGFMENNYFLVTFLMVLWRIITNIAINISTNTNIINKTKT